MRPRARRRRRTRPTGSPSWCARTRSRAPRRHERARAAQGRDARARLARSSRRPTKRACPAAPRSPSTATCSRRAVHERVDAHPRITRRARRSDDAARAPASSPPAAHVGRARRRHSRSGSASSALAFYDAIAPIVAARLDRRRRSSSARRATARRRWRAPTTEGAYLNCPFTREQYEAFIDALIAADQYHGHEFDEVPYFEGCMPVEEMAKRGRETLRFGPMKPVGLRDPRTGREAARGRAAAHGGSRRTHVEPRRLPDAAAHSRAAARVPHDSRARER